jgi:hypothetical protein
MMTKPTRENNKGRQGRRKRVWARMRESKSAVECQKYVQ